MKEQDIINRIGTSFIGYVYAGYSQLCLAFGEPSIPNRLDIKTDAEWMVYTPYGIAVIYNYKDGKRYLKEAGLDVSDICEWHVGAKNTNAYEWVKNKLNNSIGSVHSSEESNS